MGPGNILAWGEWSLGISWLGNGALGISWLGNEAWKYLGLGMGPGNDGFWLAIFSTEVIFLWTLHIHLGEVKAHTCTRGQTEGEVTRGQAEGEVTRGQADGREWSYYGIGRVISGLICYICATLDSAWLSGGVCGGRATQVRVYHC